MIKNYLYLSGGEAISKLVTFAAIAYLARVLGPVGYGYVELAGAVLLCAGLIIELGFGPYGAREIAKHPDRTAALVGEIVIVRFLLAVAAGAAVLVFVGLFRQNAAVTQLLLIYALSLLPAPLLLQWVFQGHSQMKVVAALQVLRQTVFAVVIFAFLRQPAQVWLAAVAELSGVASAAGLGVWLYLRRFGGGAPKRPGISARLLREGVPIGLSQMFWMVRMFGATVVVGFIASGQDIGYFGAAQRILVALHAFVWLYYFNLLPALSRAWQADDGGFATVNRRSLRQIAWVSLAGGLAWVLVAPAAMTAFYGAAFAPAGSVLQWLAGVAIAAGLSGHYRFGLIAAGQQNLEMLVQALGTVSAIVLIPVGYAWGGPAGVGASLVVAEVIVWLCAWWLGRRILRLHGHLELLVRPALAAILIIGLLQLLASYGPEVRLPVAMASVAVAALALDATLRSLTQAYVAAGSQRLRGWWVRQSQSAR